MQQTCSTSAAGLPRAERLHCCFAVRVDVEDELFPLQGINIRFWANRGDHPYWFDRESLEKFEGEAVLVIEPSDWRAAGR